MKCEYFLFINFAFVFEITNIKISKSVTEIGENTFPPSCKIKFDIHSIENKN